MELLFGFESLDRPDSSVVSVGSFDGVHAGHRAIMNRMNELRDKLNERSDSCAKSIVVTFSPHPRHFISGSDSGFKLLSTIEEKAVLVESCGIDIMIVLEFNETLKNTSSAQFIDLLHTKLSMKVLMAGFNHRLGNDGACSSQALRDIALRYDVEVQVMPEFFVRDHKVSSTVVRNTVMQGKMHLAQEQLLEAYMAIIENKEIEQSRFAVSSHKLLPPQGTYSVRIKDLQGHIIASLLEVQVEKDNTLRIIEPRGLKMPETINKFVLEFLG